MFNWVGLGPVLSNLFFILPAIRAFIWGNFGLAPAFFIVIFTSGSYHVCKSFPDACLFEYQRHLKLDFVLAFVALPLLAFNFIYWPKGYRFWSWWCYLLSFFLVAILVTCIESSFMTQAIIAGLSAIVVFVYWTIFYVRHHRLPNYNWGQLTLGLGLSLLGVSLFQDQNFWPQGYWANHSMWHILVAMGAFFFIGAKKPAPHWLNLAQEMEFNYYGGHKVFKLKNEEETRSMSELEKGFFYLKNERTKQRLAEEFGKIQTESVE